MKTDWTDQDAKCAMDDGWGVSQVSFSNNQLMKLDASWDDDGTLIEETVRFASDEEAWTHVLRRASRGSSLAWKALIFLARTNPDEHSRILSHLTNIQS